MSAYARIGSEVELDQRKLWKNRSNSDRFESTFWLDFSYLFTHPNGYIGYGTSAIGAIELFVEATEDYDAAKEKYLNLLFQQDIYGYSATVKEAGLTDAFDTEAAKAILEKCIAIIKSKESV